MSLHDSHRISTSSTLVPRDPEGSPPSYPHLFRITRKVSQSYEVYSLNGSRIFYGENACFHPARPDFILHSGPDSTGPTQAVCKLDFSSDINTSLWDPATDRSTQWERLTKASSFKTEYNWTTAVPKHGNDSRRLQKLVWKRTQSESALGTDPSTIASRNLKLVEDKAGKILAVFTGSNSWVEGGTLEIRADLGEEFDIMVILICITLYEKAYRASHTASGDAGPVTWKGFTGLENYESAGPGSGGKGYN